MADPTLVAVHGFWSDPSTWDRLCAVWQADAELKGLRVHGFGYPSPKKPRLPLSWTRVPDFDDVARTLATEYMTVLAGSPSIAIVAHSQGGLIVQRFLAWMISGGRARDLARIRTIVLLACPNSRSQYLASIRHVLGYGRHPQAAGLETLSRQVADTQRTVLERIVYASGVDDHQCRIPFHAYAAASDAIVPAASAQAAFPGGGTLAGNHFTILDPAARGNRTAEVVKHHILTDLEGPSASPPAFQPAQPAYGGSADRALPGVSLPGARGVQVGDNNVQRNTFWVPPSSSPTAPAVAPEAEVARGAGVTNVIDGTIHGSVIQAGTISGPVTINDRVAKEQESPSPDQD
jgi:pimeloyl-ACP methyl ester carboxylesterase